MDSQTYIEYELVDTVRDRSLVTESREEALAYFEKGWMVYEHHNTVSTPAPKISVQQIISLTWEQGELT